ncbi:MAG: pyridoxamine 5'-phosphate oxidase [Armatimonadetes bacterium]|nr:pyridoxamine 5'-phosphate oxidase [Armatimonadota bacterium]
MVPGKLTNRHAHIRTDYVAPHLQLSDLDPDPAAQWKTWLDGAFAAGVTEPHAACLSTVGPNGRPSGRMVLIRLLDPGLLTFFTNYESRKALELSTAPWAALTFYWPALHRQVRVEGSVERASAKDSDAYFAGRPYQNRLASAASPQSRVISDPGEVEETIVRLKSEFPDHVPRPANWGGFVLTPDRFEFWQGQPARLHDRFHYRLTGGQWVIERLAP